MKKFFKAVAIVTVFSVCEKFLGFLYRIYLSRAIGAEGVGTYQVALSVFAFLLTVICSGTPVTVSRMMTKYRAENLSDKVNSLITSAIVWTAFLSSAVTVGCFIAGDRLSFLFADERSLKVFFVLMPSLTFTSVYAVLRGVFWGNKDFLPFSVIELAEEICMIIAGIVIITVTGNELNGAFSAGIAVTVSYFLSFTLGMITFFARKNRFCNPRGQFLPLIRSATPVTAMRTVNSLAVSLVSVVFPLRLIASGFTRSEAMSLFGAATGQAIPLLFIPTTLIGSFTLVLIPEISESYYKKRGNNLKSEIEKATRFTALFSCLFVPVFFAAGAEAGIIVFDSYECGAYLVASAFLAPFMGLSNLTTAILNSIGCETQTLFFYVIGGIFMLLSVWFLPAACGVYALLVGFSFVYVITTVCNIALIRKKCPVKPALLGYSFTALFLTLPASFIGAALKSVVSEYLGVFITFIAVSAVSAAAYMLLAFCFGLADKETFYIRKKSQPRGFGKKAGRVKRPAAAR